MDAADPQIDPGPRPSDPASTDDQPALRDAQARLDRAREDDRMVVELRHRLTGGELPSIDPDPAVTAALAAGERPIAARDAVVVERYGPDGPEPSRVMRLYVTTARLLLFGGLTWSIPLSDIDELSIAGERVLVSLADGNGLRLDAGSPRVLRVLIAAARSHARAPEGT